VVASAASYKGETRRFCRAGYALIGETHSGSEIVAVTTQVPWAGGPREILRHGLELLRRDSDTNRRLAMIAIDNAVELMIKTYLGLPKRVTGLTISRKEYQDIAESFPALLDALEKHASDRLDGIDLGVIEWYHRLRNELYHQGNGLTVERDKIEIYAELANLLFSNLFGQKLVERLSPESELVGEFMMSWSALERGLRETASTTSMLGAGPTRIGDVVRSARDLGLLDPKEIAELDKLRQLRNMVVHGAGDWKTELSPAVVRRVREFAERFTEDEGKGGG